MEYKHTLSSLLTEREEVFSVKIQPLCFDSLWCPVFFSSYIKCVFSTCCSPPGICWLCSRLAGFMSPPVGGVWTCSCSLASGSCFTNSSFLSCSTTFFWRRKQRRWGLIKRNQDRKGISVAVSDGVPVFNTPQFFKWTLWFIYKNMAEGGGQYDK